MAINPICRISLVVTLALAMVSSAAFSAGKEDAATNDKPRTTFEFGGFFKTDFILSDFTDGPLSPGSLGRDLYVPATIPVGGEGDRYVDMHAKESRFNLALTHRTEHDERLRVFVEADFLETSDGSIDVVDSLRLRHAYVQYGHWLAGQTWTTLFNVSALPENLDFIGPSESTIFRRHAMLRFRQGPWQVALENPRSTITPNGGGARVNRDDSHRPDLVVRYDHEGQRGDVTLAAIVRQLSHVDAQSGFDDRTTAVGISVSGKIPVGDTDDFRWMISSGRGLGHYIGLNTANGAVHDAQGRLEPIASTGLFGSFRHFWSGRLRSNFTLGYFAVNNPLELTGDDVSRRAASLHSNLIFQPRPGLDMGVEWLMASRELENGLDGKLQRLQFSVKLMY